MPPPPLRGGGFSITLVLAIALMAAGIAVEIRLSSAIVGPGSAADGRDDADGGRRVGHGGAGRIGRRNRHARGRLQPDGRADSRAAALGSRQAAGRAADDRGRHRFALRPGARHRRRRSGHADQSRGRAPVRRPCGAARQTDRRGRARSADRAGRRRRAAVAGPGRIGECRRRSALGGRWRPAGVSHSLHADEGRRQPNSSARSRCSKTSRT